MTPLWTAFEIASVTDGEVHGGFSATGVAFDSREVGPGDLFVALAGETTDGHRFVDQAFAQGAAGAIVSRPIAQPHVLVNDVTAALSAIDARPHVLVRDTMTALNELGAASRARSSGRIAGVTGSVGKTGTKEALFAALDRAAPGLAHRSVKSYNNHTGVPLSLARMPREAQFGVFEMGMNHAGELAALTRLVRPHVALVTAIAPAHAAYFSGEEEIADAKGEIFEGLEPGGIAIVPYDSPHRDRLLAKARQHAGTIWTFGRGEGADVRALSSARTDRGTAVVARLPGGELSYTVAAPGDHWVSNSLAVLAAVEALGGDLAAAGLALAEMEGLAGRGARARILVDGGEALVIDESYNANPTSMTATIRQLGEEPAKRRVAVLGGMRELGAKSDDYHAALVGPLLAAGVDYALLVGDEMQPLASRLEGSVDFDHVPDAAAARERLLVRIRPGDAVLVKGSNAIGLARLVEAMTSGAMAGGKT
ncbi:UDP-N-acetylmuramoyl-tripeptide--D-alanyl-D-alanine ligase [Sphingomonas zeicaulis]|uniref:UDP-N-acetylmuramoyl-tripeptide--D-alanyl-D- alanine ligase n=1 Tax=Sphingomonas zeicaulis TaxID=1632740 RepID=UPI003D1BF726